MTESEKLAAMVTGISPDKESEEVLLETLKTAEAMIMNRLYPFGYTSTFVMPSRYDRIQIQLAIELYNQRGAEGQTGHNENGISRTWPAVNRLINSIPPVVGSVVMNA